MIKIQHLHFSYDKTPILKDISLSLPKGGFLGIIGPNGSGKTTLLKIIAGLLKNYRGEMTLEGKSLSFLSRQEIAQKIAVVPQDTSIPFSFTALEIVLMGRTPHLKLFAFETQRDVDIALKAMELTEVRHLAHRLMDDLSGGEKQRVIVARALAQQAPILLLDEPTAHLDIKHQIDIHNLVQRLNRDKGITIINVLHDLNLASIYCPEVLMLKEGSIGFHGPTKKVMTQDNIEKIFEAKIYVGQNKDTGQSYYLPRS